MMTTLSRFSPCLIVVVVLTGCAVTKIDVDVYKGPLANHEEVQLEQMAVMAIGAKPILMRLRDRLEEAKREGSTKGPRPIRKTFGDSYDTCIQEGKELVEFKSDDARRVNALLCLYGDQYLETLQSRALEALQAYRKAWQNFQGGNRSHATWTQFKSGMHTELISWTESSGSDPKPLPYGHPLTDMCDSNGEACKKGYKAIGELIKAYSQLLDKDGPKPSSAESIWKANGKTVHRIPQTGTESPPMNNFATDYTEGDTTEKFQGSNWAYDSLSNDSLVEAHADLLFKKKESDKKRKFVRSVTLIAKSFLSARAALRDLLQVNLDILDTFRQRLGSESAQDLGRRSYRAQLISRLIGWANFRMIIKFVETAPDWFSQRLREFTDRAKANERVLSGKPQDLKVFKAFLVSELTRTPLETAAALREADLSFPNPSLPNPSLPSDGKKETYQLERLKHAARREFGLVRVIHKDEKDIKEAEKLQEQSSATVTGLDRGRLHDGLESMIEDYLEQDDISKMYGGNDDSSEESHRLRDALVRFAQKMLFVANYDNLLSRDNRNLGFWKYLVKPVTEPVEEFFTDKDKRIREYTQVLQAVGNSILNQADELQARETHGLSLKDSARRARYGASRILDQTPQQTVAAVVDKFEAERINASNSLQVAREDKKTTLTARVNALKTTVAAINELKASVVAKALSANVPNDPSATFLLLKATVAEELDKAENLKTVTKAKWQTVWNELDGINPPTSAETTGQNDFKDDKTSRGVLDRLIAVLEYERIEAIKQGGTSDRAAHLTEALRAAYESRARLTFIRPASSYLRSSYPTASLQSDPGLTWRNELQRHSLKSIPIFGGRITRYLDKSDISPEVRSQIDRQFWQNINSIRVSGAGRTNYVMVQDDIGNWYVKSYSADSEDISKSALGLGQFALGGQLGTDLVNRPAPGTGSALARQPTTLEAVFAKHQEEYDRATEETFKAVKAALDGLPSEVQKAWDEDPGTEKVRTKAADQLQVVKVHLAEAVKELNKDDPNKPEQVAQRPARIVEALRAMDRYRGRLEAYLRENIPEKPSDETTDAITEERRAAINAVITDLNAVVKAKVERFLKQREDTINAYENAIVFIGEVAGQASMPTGETSDP